MTESNEQAESLPPTLAEAATGTGATDDAEPFPEVFEQAAIGMATMTLDGRLLRCNPALARLVGRREDELVGARYADIAGNDALTAAVLADLQRAGIVPAQLEHDIPATGRRALVTLAPVRDREDGHPRVLLQMQDVTGQRGAEEELRRSEERFRLLVEAVRDYAIFMLTPTGIVASWNPGAERIKGYTAEEIVGRHFRVFYPAERQAERHPEHELEWALRDGHYEEEGWRVRKDGSLFWASVLITPVRDHTGRHIGFAKVTRDSTRRRHAEEALRQSEERLRLLVEAVQDYAIFMLDPAGRVASWNTGATRINGYTAEEIVGRHFRVFYPAERQAERHPEHELEWALRDGRYEEEGWRVRKDGRRFWANVVITTVRDERGRHVGFTKVTRDMTERREILQRLEEANRRLEEAAQQQAQFLAVTAHELRMPVGILGGAADMLSEHWADLTEDEREGLLGSMTSSAHRLRRLLADLLTVSRLESGAVRMTMERVPVAAVVLAAAAVARQIDPQAEIEVSLPSDVTVYGDRDRLAQAVENLIVNALRHGASPVRVGADTRDGTVEIRVSDAGPGVPEELRPRLFQRFATGRERSGTGLGLFIVRELARAQGGEARYEPGDGTGAGAFVLSLPAEEHRA